MSRLLSRPPTRIKFMNVRTRSTVRMSFLLYFMLDNLPLGSTSWRMLCSPLLISFHIFKMELLRLKLYIYIFRIRILIY